MGGYKTSQRRVQSACRYTIMSGSGSVTMENNINSFPDSSLSKSAADRVMWSLWTMGEEDAGREETDFNIDNKQVSLTFSGKGKEAQEKFESSDFYIFNSKKSQETNERRDSTKEPPTWAGSFGTGRMERKNSETLFNLEY